VIPSVSFCGLLTKRLGKAPSTLTLDDLTVPFIGDFLDSLETGRKNSARTRNVRLAAIHSFFRYVAWKNPPKPCSASAFWQIPAKRQPRRAHRISPSRRDRCFAGRYRYLTWIGRRDRTMLLLAVQTGLRVSELVGLRCDDIFLGTGAHVHCLGKGRKERCTPLRAKQ